MPVFILKTSLRCRNLIFLMSEVPEMKVVCCPLVAERRHCRSLLRTRFSDDCWTFLKSSRANTAVVLETRSRFCDCLVLGSAPSSPRQSAACRGLLAGSSRLIPAESRPRKIVLVGRISGSSSSPLQPCLGFGRTLASVDTNTSGFQDELEAESPACVETSRTKALGLT